MQPSLSQAIRYVRSNHPASASIPDARIEEWYVASIAALEKDRQMQLDASLYWHMRRLTGIGASEIGALVMADLGEVDLFATPQSIYYDKLMYSPVLPTGVDARRGALMEPIVRNAFLSRVGGKSREDMVNLVSAHRHSKHAWMIGNPDDIVEIKGRLFLVDYKAPTTKALEDYARKGDVRFNYKAQLNQLDMLCEDAGVEVDGLLLASFDYSRFDIDLAVIERDIELRDQIVNAGGKLHHAILTNARPPSIFKSHVDRETLDPAVMSALDEKARTLTQILQVSSACDDYAKTLKKEIADQFETAAIRVGKDSKLVLPGQSLSVKESFDLDRLERLVATHKIEGFDRENPETHQAAYEAALILDEEAPLCVVETVQLRTISNKSGSNFEFLEACKATSKNVVDHAISLTPANEVDFSKQPPAKKIRKVM